ncbi:hypothetical protein XM79_u0125 [Vibrio vulnificus]|nr:hypothetical protein XM78_u0109 [Vibrio vulnificus]OQK59511.1 hypothetical protein XM79_u0125 [Vibrio vulnificus]
MRMLKAICEERNRPNDGDGQRYRVRFIADKLSTKKVLRLQAASHCI